MGPSLALGTLAMKMLDPTPYQPLQGTAGLRALALNEHPLLRIGWTAPKTLELTGAPTAGSGQERIHAFKDVESFGHACNLQDNLWHWDPMLHPNRRPDITPNLPDVASRWLHDRYVRLATSIPTTGGLAILVAVDPDNATPRPSVVPVAVRREAVLSVEWAPGGCDLCLRGRVYGVYLDPEQNHLERLLEWLA